MIKLIKPKFDLKTKEYTSYAKVKVNIKHEFTPVELVKLATHFMQLADAADKLNHKLIKVEPNDTL